MNANSATTSTPFMVVLGYVYFLAVPLLLGMAGVKEFPELVRPHPLLSWMPQWSGIAALWCIPLWQLLASALFVAPSNRNAPPGPLAKTYLSRILLVGFAVCLLWGSFEILPVFLISSALGCSTILIYLCERHTGIVGFIPRDDWTMPPSKSLDRRGICRLTTWWIFYVVLSSTMVPSTLIVLKFMELNGVQIDGILERSHALALLPWIMLMILPAWYSFFLWFTIRLNYPAATLLRTIGVFSMLITPLFAVTAWLSTLLSYPPPAGAIGGLIGTLIVMPAMHIRKARKLLRENSQCELPPATNPASPPPEHTL